LFDKYDEVLAIARTFGSEASRELNLRVSLDEAIFKEAFISAQVTCAFHGRGAPNHIKQVSHLCFWILKLKPFSLAPRLKDDFAGKIRISSIIDHFDTDYKERLKTALRSPINEMVALTITTDLISKGYLDIASKLDRVKRPGQEKAEIDVLNERMKYNDEKVSRVFGDLVGSFREHNYSARGLAIMMGAIYSTGFESRHAEA